jgi:hypothetical protein
MPQKQQHRQLRAVMFAYDNRLGSMEGNMGPQGVELRFVTAQPTAQQLVAEAERLGGIDIDMLDQTESGVTVAFSGFPKGRVNISTSSPHCLFIIDHSLVAPALFQLLFRAGVALGGHSNATTADPSLQPPLTNDIIRKAIRRVHFGSALGSFWLILSFAAVVVLVVGVFRFLSQNSL